MKIKRLAILTLIGFVGACAHKTDSYNFETVRSVNLDESKLVLTTFPSELEEIDDTLLAAINSYKTLSLYNIRTGKNIQNFSTGKIDFDSLMKCTYQKKYEDSRRYRYYTSQDGLSDEAGQVKSFQYSKGTFYVLVSTMAEVSYLEAANANQHESEQVLKLKEQYGSKNVKVMDYMHFIVETDRDFKIKKIIPIYESKKLKEQNYYPIFERAFLIDGDEVYVYLTNYNEVCETMRSKKQLQDHYIARINLYDGEDVDCFLSNKEIDFKGFSFNDYFAAPIKLSFKNKVANYSNSKDICEVESGKKIFTRDSLLPNESIESFYRDDQGQLIAITYLTDAKKRPTEFEIKYAIDSVHSHKIKVYNESTRKWTAEGKLPANAHFPFLIGSSKIFYFDKNKEHYILKYIPYNEK